jgi:hypothetical protein
MADLTNANRSLIMKRFEHTKMVALQNVLAREIRIMELEDEINRCRVDMESQKKVIHDMDKEIQLHTAEFAKVDAEAKK